MQVNTALSRLAKQVNEARTKRGYSVSRLANLKKCGVSESTIRRIEKAHVTGYNPKLSTLVKLSQAVSKPVNELIGQVLKQDQHAR